MTSDQTAQIESIFNSIHLAADSRNREMLTAVLPQVDQLCRLYVLLDSQERSEVSARVERGISGTIMALAKSYSVDAVTDKSPEKIFLGVVALVIEDLHFDARDTMIPLAALHNSGLKLGLDPDEIFRRAAVLASDKMSEYLISFVNRPQNLKSLEAFMLEETEGVDGFGYREILTFDCRTIDSGPFRVRKSKDLDGVFKSAVRVLRNLFFA